MANQRQRLADDGRDQSSLLGLSEGIVPLATSTQQWAYIYPSEFGSVSWVLPIELMYNTRTTQFFAIGIQDASEGGRKQERERERGRIEPLNARRCRARRAVVDDEKQSSDESGRNTFDAIMARQSSDNRLHGNRVAEPILADNFVRARSGIVRWQGVTRAKPRI